uniref:EF-hand domain-containing protein n=2 Tax=Caenorhabditis tropicalis TaxID=1561998 RepID=A0A1I7TFJ3_9PELO
MSEPRQMKTIADLKFPSNVFSPLATSSPKLTKMRAPIRDQSWTSSSDESSGNATALAITGIDETHLNVSKTSNISTSSSSSVRTALEYVDPEIFHNKQFCEVITREELHEAIAECKMASDNFTKEQADIYATVVTERVLWTACRTWSGTLPVSTKASLKQYVQYACEDWYMRYTGQLCVDELQHLSNFKGMFDWQSVAIYCYEKGMPTKVIDRVFAKNLVRRTTGDYLDCMEMTWLLFAMIGTDEMQSIEYWFRVLDVHSTGVLSFAILEQFYEEISKILAKENVMSLPYSNVISQFTDILGTNEWTLRAFKNNSHLVHRVVNGFINAIRFLDQETNEKTNGERMDDESFGQGNRTRWQRLIDHEFDAHYQQNQSPTSSPESSNLSE